MPNQEPIKFVSPSELQEIIVCGWKYYSALNSFKMSFSEHTCIFIGSTKCNLLLSIIKQPSGQMSFIINPINDEKALPNTGHLFTYHFYTLDPKGLENHFQKLKDENILIGFLPENAEKILVTTAWDFLKACGIEKHVKIKNKNTCPKFFISANTPCEMSQKFLSNMNIFGNPNYRSSFGIWQDSLLTKAKQRESLNMGRNTVRHRL